MNFFDEGSPYLDHPLLTSARTEAELDRIEQLVGGFKPGSLIVDLGCGFGRHCLGLAERGHHAIGIDPSQTMMQAAKARVPPESDSDGTVRFHQGAAATATELVEPEAVDLALCLFTTFGQRSQHAPPSASTTQLLATAAKVLKPGGALVLELPDRERAVQMLVAEEQLGPTKVTRSYDPATEVLSECFETPDRTFKLAYQLFDSSSLRTLLGDAGFVVETILESALVPPPPTFLTVVATRR